MLSLHQSVKPARDNHFRLMCGAAISTHRTANGEPDRDRILGHVSKLEEGVDAVAVSTAHGFPRTWRCHPHASKRVHRSYPHRWQCHLRRGRRILADAGADTIKIGQGPGSICTTRIVAGVGIPQMTALYCASLAAKKRGVKILADGGITKSGDTALKALTLADGVMWKPAGCNEAPGQIIEIDGKLYKQYRGMGSSAAMKMALRYGSRPQRRHH